MSTIFKHVKKKILILEMEIKQKGFRGFENFALGWRSD